MSWLYKYFRLVLDSTYPALEMHGATLRLSGTGATLTLASGATADEFSTDGTLSGNSDTAIPTEKAVKTYVDTYATALKWKDVVVCATTADGTLATAYANGQTVDGVTLVTGDRILLKNQTDQKVNGIYTVNATGAPTRATDADTASELLGCIVPVLEGTTNADSAWVNSNDTITLGSSNITFILYGGMKSGNGLTLTADVMSIDVAITADLSTIQTFTNKTLTSPKINEDVVMSGTATQLNDAVATKHSQNTDTGTTGTTFTIDSDSTTGKLALQAAGGGNFTLTLQTPTIAGAVAITLPAVTGTLATLAGVEALTNKSLALEGGTLLGGTGTPIFSYGTIDTQVTTAQATDLCAFQMYIQSTANPGADTSLIAMYLKTENTTIDQPNRHMQCLLVNTKLNFNCFDAYAVQGHITVATQMETAANNAHITGISGKAVLTAQCDKGWVTGGLFIIDGAADVTGTGTMCHGVAIVAETGTIAVDSMLYINNDGTATNGINFVGNFTKGIDFSNGTWSQGTANFVVAYGTASAAVSVAATASIIPIQCNLSIASDAGDTAATSYFKVATGGALTGQIANMMLRTTISHDMFDAYGLQSHLTFGDTATVSTTDNNAHLTAISGKVTFDTSTVTKGWVTAGLFIIEGAGTCSQMCHGVSIVEEAGSTGAQSMLHLNTDVGTTPYFSFAGADGSGNSIYTHTAAGTQLGTIKILVNGDAKWIPFMQAE